MDHPSKDLRLCTVALSFCRKFATSFNAFLSMSFHLARNATVLWWGFSYPSNFSVAPAEHFSVFFNNAFVRFTFTLSASQIYVQIFSTTSTWFHPFLSHGSHFLFFPIFLMSSTYSLRIPFVPWTKQIDNCHSILFSHPSSSRTFSKCLSHKRPASGWPCKFRSWRTTGSLK